MIEILLNKRQSGATHKIKEEIKTSVESGLKVAFLVHKEALRFIYDGYFKNKLKIDVDVINIGTIDSRIGLDCRYDKIFIDNLNTMNDSKLFNNIFNYIHSDSVYANYSINSNYDLEVIEFARAVSKVEDKDILKSTARYIYDMTSKHSSFIDDYERIMDTPLVRSDIKFVYDMNDYSLLTRHKNTSNIIIEPKFLYDNPSYKS